jgi:alpha-glucosidase
MVLNHTSDKHRWFLAAASSREDAKHDFYVWNNGRAGSTPPAPPNNWESFFGGSAWTFVPAVQQFYYHKFYRQQPDLNWRNPAVERAMFDAMRFWLDRGVAGFRLDAITTLFEDPELRDEPVVGGTNAYGDPVLNDIYTSDMPEVHDVIKRMRSMVDRYPDSRVLIGETYLQNTAALDQWYGGANHNELQLPMDTQIGFATKLDAAVIRRQLQELETGIHGSQPLLVFDNHDNPRSIDRFGDGAHDMEIAKLIAALLLTPRDAALLYQGEEIGQRTAPPKRIEDVKDPIGRSGWPKEKGRDGERTPMQWDLSNAQAGFSTDAKTWLPVTPSYRAINVESEWADPDSLLNWHKKLIDLRRQAVAHGAHTVFLDERNPRVLSYARVDSDGKALIVVLNISAQPQTVSLDLNAAGVRHGQLSTVLASPVSMHRPSDEKKLQLAPYGCWIGTR